MFRLLWKSYQMWLALLCRSRSFYAQYFLSLFYRVYSYLCIPWSRIRQSLRSPFYQEGDTILINAICFHYFHETAWVKCSFCSLTQDPTISAFKNCRIFYDRKTLPSSLKNHHFCFIVNPKLSIVNDHLGKSLTKWLSIYRFEPV